jgi:tetratricopeptide (TPR) repeat protein
VSAEIKILSESSAIEQIIETVKKSGLCEAPFTLVVGAGFSQGLVPITRDIVYKNLPTLDESFVPEIFKPSNPRAQFQYDQEKQRQERHENEQIERRAISFWKRFVKENETCGFNVEFSNRGLPLRYDEAYKYAFDARSIWPFASQADRRKFLRQLMRPEIPRLNAAHFFLASILGSQPDIVVKKDLEKLKSSSLFKFQSGFSRLILTTNFDPFLQIALQFANRLYFMSDTPDLDEEDLSENQTGVIHLVYVHGSIHRHAQANTDDEINKIKERNAKILAPILKTRPVIVIGYSGWDDVIVEALAACEKFEHGLYWLGLRPKPLANVSFGLRVPEILQKPGANYVPIKGAGHFMSQLNSHLVQGLPLLDNPIASLQKKIALINLDELGNSEIGISEANLKGVTQITQNIVGKSTFKLAKDLALKGLVAAEDFFLKQCEDGSIGHLQTQAVRANFRSERIENCNKVLAIPNISIIRKSSTLELRADTFFKAGKTDEATADWTQIIEMSDVPNKLVWQALLGRALAIWQKTLQQPEENRDFTGAIADLTRVIEENSENPNMPQELRNLRVECFFHRGGVLCDAKKYKESVTDFTSVIETGGCSNSAFITPARGLFCWAFVREKMSENRKAIDDYTLIIKSPFRAPCGEQSEALSKRGWLYYLENDFQNFLHDMEMALQNSSPPKHIEYNLGLALLANGRDIDAIFVYRKVGEKYPRPIDEALADLNDATKKWLIPERAKLCIELLESFKKEPTVVSA